MSEAPKYPGAPERIRRQFAEAAPAGRVFLAVVYSVSFAGVAWFTVTFQPKTHAYSVPYGNWLREMLGDTGGNVADIASVVIPLAILWYVGFVWLPKREARKRGSISNLTHGRADREG